LELLASNTGKGRIENSPPSLAIGEHTIVLFLCSNKTPTWSVPTEVEGMPINVCQTKTHRLPTEVEGSNQSHVQ
jgi:hypothetical protein